MKTNTAGFRSQRTFLRREKRRRRKNKKREEFSRLKNSSPCNSRLRYQPEGDRAPAQNTEAVSGRRIETAVRRIANETSVSSHIFSDFFYCLALDRPVNIPAIGFKLRTTSGRTRITFLYRYHTINIEVFSIYCVCI